MSVLAALHARYRRSGADLPFGDPRRAHGVGMEGYYWRLTDPAAGRVIAALCGVCAAADGSWALVALAAHPERVVRHAVVPVAAADPERLSVRAGDVLVADEHGVSVDLGAGARIDARFPTRISWPKRLLGGSGLGQVVPGLGQYWHPHLLGGSVEGHAELGPAQVDLGAAVPYAEKNWGSRFAAHWWWGQAQAFGDPGICVAFAGGRMELAGVLVAPTAVVVALDGEVLRLAPPLARTVAAVGDDVWRVRARQAGVEVELTGSGAGGAGALLPVPLPAQRRVELGSRQMLAAHLQLAVRRRGAIVYAGESRLAGLERAAT